MSRSLVGALRGLDRAIGRRSGRRRVLVDARTPVNFTMVAPIYRAMSADPRVAFSFTASEDPDLLSDIYHEAPGATLVPTGRARFMRFDAYVASDFMWQALPRGTCRIMTFHGVGGKYGFDALTESMRMWDRIFFANRRRLRNFIACGAIDADSPAIRMIGLPKTDALVDGTWTREGVLATLGLEPALPTILYAPTWSPASSLNAMGLDLIERIMAAWSGSANLIVKLHDRSRDLRPRYSGGIDWAAAIAPLLRNRTGVLADGHDITPYLVAADVMITDHSSAGFEFLLRDRPIVRIDRPELVASANIHPDYVALLASVSESVSSPGAAVAALDRALSAPDDRGEARRTVAEDLFYRPGGATARAVRQLYEAIELDPMLAAVVQEAACRP